MMNKRFPLYDTHDDVRCFRCCGDDMGAPRASGYAPGRWMRYCARCSVFTFYDVRLGEAARMEVVCQGL